MSHQADSNGLVQGHAYTITGLYRVHTQELGRICLLRIRNPWGDKNEWKGEQNKMLVYLQTFFFEKNNLSFRRFLTFLLSIFFNF